MITVDGIQFDIGIVKVTRKASLSQTSLGTTLDLRKHYETKGTYYDYDVEFALNRMNVEAYDSLYEILTSPVEYHTVTMPYGQETITFIANAKVASDNLVRNFSVMKRWGGLKVTFEALEPQKEA